MDKPERKKPRPKTEQEKRLARATRLMFLLEQHAEGKHPLVKTQLDAINILLKKLVPDLKAMEVSGDLGINMQVTKITEEIISKAI